MEFNKIAGAIIGTLLLMMVIAKIGNTLVPEFHPPKDKPGTEGPATTQPETTPDKPVAELLATADAAAGEKRARNACVSCHTFEKGGRNGTGPNLYDIVGRKKGSHAGYAYSDAIKNAGGEWTYEDLFKFLANPARAYPGTKMALNTGNAEQRAQLIAYLRTLSDSPKPLPAAEKKTDAPAPKPDEKKAEPPKPAEPPKAAEPPKPATPPAEEKKN
jgi:cytochrome c